MIILWIVMTFESGLSNRLYAMIIAEVLTNDEL